MIELKDKVDCCGCTACQNICGHRAISFRADDEGFMYPEIDLAACTNCGLCESVCPIIQRKRQIPEPNNLAFYAARCTDRDTLFKSSSGGVFSALASKIIENGGCVIGAIYNDDMEVEHFVARTNSDLDKLRGSKYSQSNLKDLFKTIRKMLITGETVLFSGTPCQVAGLKLFLRKTYPTLYTIDLVCHAVPSPRIFKDYINYVSGRLGEKVVWMNMRDKEKLGWSHRFSYRFKLASGRDVIDPISIPNWGRLFFSKMIDRPSCHKCLFTNFSRPGDITLADFWDDRKERPEIRSKEGTSLVVVNSDNGKTLLDLAKDDLQLWPVSKDEAWQPCLERPTEPSALRDAFWDDYHKYGFKKVLHKYFSDSKYKILKHYVNRLIGRRW